MDKFRKAIRRLISDRGESFLEDKASFGLLADYGAFEDDLAAKDIFLALRDSGCLSALLGNWQSGSLDALHKLTHKRAFSEKKVYEVLNILAVECGADISAINPAKPTSVNNNLVKPPVNKTVNIAGAVQQANLAVMTAPPQPPPPFQPQTPQTCGLSTWCKQNRKSVIAIAAVVVGAIILTLCLISIVRHSSTSPSVLAPQVDGDLIAGNYSLRTQGGFITTASVECVRDGRFAVTVFSKYKPYSDTLSISREQISLDSKSQTLTISLNLNGKDCTLTKYLDNAEY